MTLLAMQYRLRTDVIFLFQVFIYRDNFIYLIKKEGQVRGEYFGAAVAAIDINKDGLHDLLVGAPFYYEENSVDEGRVYVYMNQVITAILVAGKDVDDI